VTDKGERGFMEMAIQLAKMSIPEDDKPHPKVGVVLVNGGVIGKGYRSQYGNGDHAEFTMLERSLPNLDVTGSTLYTTLEPCTRRTLPKIACIRRIINRRITRVVIGILDPNPDENGQGLAGLREKGIAIDFFPEDLANEIRLINADFIAFQNNRRSDEITPEQ